MFGCEFVLTHDDDSFNLLKLSLHYCYVLCLYKHCLFKHHMELVLA